MTPDKYSAVWVSHSSISDYLNCPRLYYLRAIYKDPVTGHKITYIQPPLALGQVVHEVVESLSTLPMEERFTVSPLKKFDVAWEGVSGKKGGFSSREEEETYKERGREMIKRVVDNPGPLANKAVKIKADGGLPYYWISEEDNIILCGKIDWLEYLPKTDSVHIIDFKSGKWEESEDSLQLPIYYLLVKNLQKRDVSKASYWYLNKSDEPQEVELPDLTKAYGDVMKIAKRIKLARQVERFVCPHGGCKYCLPMEDVANGKGEFVGLSEYKQDIYILR